jgi:hypothetical protein
VISRLSGSAGGPGGGGAFGYSMYLKSAIGEYFLTHFGSRAVNLGQSVSRGQLLGTIADYPDRADHIHEGLHRYATGTRGAGKGWAWVGEKGRELVNFKGGEQVLPHSASMRVAGYSSGTMTASQLAGLNRLKLSRMGPLEAGLALQGPSIKGNRTQLAPPQVDEAVKDNTKAIEDNTAQLELQRLQYQAIIAQDYQAKYNVSQSQYTILAQAITDVVSGRLGATLGLGLSGLRAPAGSVARL